MDANISKTSLQLACLNLAAQTFCNGKVQCWVFFWLLVVWVWKETDKFPLRSDLLAFSPRRCLACCAFSVFAVAVAAEATLFDVDLSSLTKPPLWEPSFEEIWWTGNVSWKLERNGKDGTIEVWIHCTVARFWVNEMKWNEMKWNEMRWDEMKWDAMRWNEMKWNEMRWTELRWDELKWNEWNEMRWNELKLNEMRWN